MATNGKNLICLLDYSSEQIRSIIDSAKELKRNRHRNEPQVMNGKTGVLIFEKPSLRTRITFETAIYELGGHAINLDSGMVQMGKRESVEDVARNLGRWVDLIVLRTFSHDTLVKVAMNSSIPVINALTDNFHPCQALAFAQTVQETHNTANKIKVVFVGDGNNVAAELMILSAKLGYDFTLACPQGYELPGKLISTCTDIGIKHGCTITVSHDPKTAVADASFIYTDVWASMGQESQENKRKKDFSSFQINAGLLSAAPADVRISHCLPAHRGEEITSEVLDSPASIAFDEAENRLHVQKAVIVHLLSNLS
jgi:ornithine carbamoyltransferase